MTPDPFALFARTFVIGIAVAAPVGAMGVLCMQRTLSRGWRAGLSTGLGIATADALYAGLAAFGVAAVSAAFVEWQDPLRVVGGVVLVYLGVRSMLAPVRDAACDEVLPVSHGSLYAGAVALTLTNPMTIMAFGAVFAGAGLTVSPSVSSAALATLGVGAGSLSWWIALTASVTVARRSLGEDLVRWVTRLSGLVIVAFGVIAIGSVVL